MLHEFITIHHGDIVARTQERVRGRPWPSVSPAAIEHGVPLFLTQLSETLRLESTADPFPSGAISVSAARHGAELLAAGFSVSQVVHDYGDICQAITEIAVEHDAPITVEEFHTLNRCLDMAIAEAVAEHARLTAEGRSEKETERLGYAAHELRDLLNAAFLAFHALKRGTVAINGSTGAVLGRSLTGLRHLIDRTLSEVRLATGNQRRERLRVTALVDEIAAAGILHSEYRDIRFTVDAVDPTLEIDGDPQLLASAMMNLLQNAFKYTPGGGAVVLRTRAQGERLIIEVQDECGGIPATTGNLFQAFGNRRGSDRSGLGLGLSIARQAVRAHGGDIHIRNMPGTGCIFAIDVPLAPTATAFPKRVSVRSPPPRRRHSSRQPEMSGNRVNGSARRRVLFVTGQRPGARTDYAEDPSGGAVTGGRRTRSGGIVMRDQMGDTYPLAFRAVQDRAPDASGVYGIFTPQRWLHIGETDDIRGSLMNYLNDPDVEGLADRGPLSFSFEEVPPSRRTARRLALIARLAPALGH